MKNSKNSNTRKILAMLIAFAMVLSFVPVVGLAADASASDITAISNYFGSRAIGISIAEDKFSDTAGGNEVIAAITAKINEYLATYNSSHDLAGDQAIHISTAVIWNGTASAYRFKVQDVDTNVSESSWIVLGIVTNTPPGTGGGGASAAAFTVPNTGAIFTGGAPGTNSDANIVAIEAVGIDLYTGDVVTVPGGTKTDWPTEVAGFTLDGKWKAGAPGASDIKKLLSKGGTLKLTDVLVDKAPTKGKAEIEESTGWETPLPAGATAKATHKIVSDDNIATGEYAGLMVGTTYYQWDSVPAEPASNIFTFATVLKPQDSPSELCATRTTLPP
ncbi:hypothetical protein FACS1894202_13000 [Clostridia bacterium]|nr:hypothetical protein FACS1894202_12990 [Clostridia bacterium]GHU91482.1 hypothetical protein FACS1894202_13000 [Clostridia bacterium]